MSKLFMLFFIMVVMPDGTCMANRKFDCNDKEEKLKWAKLHAHFLSNDMNNDAEKLISIWANNCGYNNLLYYQTEADGTIKII